jgi:hypothetical protein
MHVTLTYAALTVRTSLLSKKEYLVLVSYKAFFLPWQTNPRGVKRSESIMGEESAKGILALSARDRLVDGLSFRYLREKIPINETVKKTTKVEGAICRINPRNPVYKVATRSAREKFDSVILIKCNHHATVSIRIFRPCVSYRGPYSVFIGLRYWQYLACHISSMWAPGSTAPKEAPGLSRLANIPYDIQHTILEIVARQNRHIALDLACRSRYCKEWCVHWLWSELIFFYWTPLRSLKSD